MVLFGRSDQTRQSFDCRVSLSKKSSESWAFLRKYGKIEAGDEDDYKA